MVKGKQQYCEKMVSGSDRCRVYLHREAKAKEMMNYVPNAGFRNGDMCTYSKRYMTKGPCMHLQYEGLQNGVMVAWLEQHGKESDPLAGAQYERISEAVSKQWHGEEEEDEPSVEYIDGIFQRRMTKNPNPKEPRWDQFLWVVGDYNNTYSYREDIAENFVEYLSWMGFRVKVGKDHSCNCLAPNNHAMMDNDVYVLMQDTHPDMSPNDIVEDDAIMSLFWESPDHGREVVEKIELDFMKRH